MHVYNCDLDVHVLYDHYKICCTEGILCPLIFLVSSLEFVCFYINIVATFVTKFQQSLILSMLVVRSTKCFGSLDHPIVERRSTLMKRSCGFNLHGSRHSAIV
jgi:hypothetical protein